MTNFAVALARSDGDWQSAELEIEELRTLEGLTDVVADELDLEAYDAIVSLIEADDWFAVVRVSADEDPKVYVSDAVDASRTALGQTLLIDVGETEDGLDSGPAGDADMLADLGVRSADLAMIATKTGLLPADALAEIAGRIGAGAVLEEYL